MADHKFKIGDIYFGTADGEVEALEKSDFVNYFYEYDNLVQKAMQPLRYLILGKKGAGKTLLGEYINHKLNELPNSISKIIAFDEFRMHYLRELRADDTPPNEYIPIWHYIILIELVKVIISNEKLKDSEICKKLKLFIAKNYQKLILTQNAENDIQKLKKVNENADWIGDLVPEASTAHNQESYIFFIPVLESLIINLLEVDPNFNYNLILDKLDDRFTNEEVYRNSIISLIKAVDNFNKNCVRNKLKTKVTILLRNDIFSLLNDTDLNKREGSNSIRIDWGDVAKYESPLFDLVIKKIKASIPALQNETKQEIINKLFPRTIKQSHSKVPTDKYLLGRTLFRPRDIITYLSLIADKFPEETAFTEKMFLDVQHRYSEYFLKEIENEMNGHLKEEQIREIISLMIMFGKFDFTYEEIKQFEGKRKILTTYTLEEALKTLFNFSIIGNYVVERNNRWRHTWKHRHDRVEFDFEKRICLHYGLWKYFNV